MYYSIEHKTHFRYSAPISETVTEVHMQPRSEGNQRCLHFRLATSPAARVSQTVDFLHNIVHFFDMPAFHDQMTILAEATVEIHPLDPLPDQLPMDTWASLAPLMDEGDYWDYLMPSPHIPLNDLLRDFLQELNIERSTDPLTLLRHLNTQLYRAFDYVPNITSVDSLIDDALTTRKGVCQDFAHIMIGAVRTLGIPARYVSGYLFHRKSDQERSTPDASHAWMEAYLPTLGWVGFDPTNNVLAGDRHIRASVGRDYSDVPPTRGVFKGSAESELEVEVHITPSDKPLAVEAILPVSEWKAMDDIALYQQQQQQQ